MNTVLFYVLCVLGALAFLAVLVGPLFVALPREPKPKPKPAPERDTRWEGLPSAQADIIREQFEIEKLKWMVRWRESVRKRRAQRKRFTWMHRRGKAIP